MLALCLMLSVIYYAQNYGGIVGWSLATVQASILKSVFLKMPIVTIWSVFQNQVTYTIASYIVSYQILPLGLATYVIDKYKSFG